MVEVEDPRHRGMEALIGRIVLPRNNPQTRFDYWYRLQMITIKFLVISFVTQGKFEFPFSFKNMNCSSTWIFYFSFNMLLILCFYLDSCIKQNTNRSKTTEKEDKPSV